MSEPNKPWKPDAKTCRQALSDFGVRLATARAYAIGHSDADEDSCYRAMAGEALQWLELLKEAEAKA